MKRNVGLVFAAAVAAIAGAWVYTSMSEPRQPVPTPASDPAPLKLASTVPTFTLTDREGRPRTLNDWSGRSLIVNF
jgi:cytochrome oxidase Cu insertion factor (SCO1/SenC/PrrC family)